MSRCKARSTGNGKPLGKICNAPVARRGRFLRVDREGRGVGVVLSHIGDGRSFTCAPWPEAFLILLKEGCELLAQDTK